MRIDLPAGRPAQSEYRHDGDVVSERPDLRARLHVALDALLDALDAYRAAPVEDELVYVKDLPFEPKARDRLVREGHLRVVRVGRRLYTKRSYVSRLVDTLPAIAKTKPAPGCE